MAMANGQEGEPRKSEDKYMGSKWMGFLKHLIFLFREQCRFHDAWIPSELEVKPRFAKSKPGVSAKCFMPTTSLPTLS